MLRPLFLAAEVYCQPPRTYVVSDGCPVDRRDVPPLLGRTVGGADALVP